MNLYPVYMKMVNNDSSKYNIRCCECDKILNFYFNISTKEKFIQQMNMKNHNTHLFKALYFMEFCYECDLNRNKASNKAIKEDFIKEWNSNLKLEKQVASIMFPASESKSLCLEIDNSTNTEEKDCILMAGIEYEKKRRKDEPEKPKVSKYNMGFENKNSPNKIEKSLEKVKEISNSLSKNKKI